MTKGRRWPKSWRRSNSREKPYLPNEKARKTWSQSTTRSNPAIHHTKRKSIIKVRNTTKPSQNKRPNAIQHKKAARTWSAKWSHRVPPPISHKKATHHQFHRDSTVLFPFQAAAARNNRRVQTIARVQWVRVAWRRRRYSKKLSDSNNPNQSSKTIKNNPSLRKSLKPQSNRQTIRRPSKWRKNTRWSSKTASLRKNIGLMMRVMRKTMIMDQARKNKESLKSKIEYRPLLVTRTNLLWKPRKFRIW